LPRSRHAGPRRPRRVPGRWHTAIPRQRPAPRRKLSYKEQREFDSLPAHIEALETEQKTIDAALAAGGGSLYANDPARAAAFAARHAEIEEALFAALERWEALSGSPG
ncbi:MAG: ABC transporter ATP-binding protein, partial [Comamonadaceae bacterium]